MVGFITAARTKVTVALLVIASTSHLAGAGGPVVSSIVNGADQSAAPLAPGSIAILNGTALAGTSATFSAPLPTSSSGVSVSVNGLAAPLEAIGPTSITFQIPYETTLTTVAVTVTNGDLTSSAYLLSIAAASIGVFSVFNVSNSLQNSASHAVAPGAGLLAYVTGIGAVNPAVADGASATASPAVNNVSATINGVSAPVVFAGAVAGPPGFAQINLTVPSGLASGSYPLVFTENDRSSAPFTIFVDVPPTVTSVTPNHASPGAGNTAVSIAGSTFTQGSTVSWKAPNGTIVPISPSLIQAAQIAATIPAALLSTAGTAQVAVQDAAGVLSNSVSFSIGNPAVITSLTPNNALVGSSSASLSIAGQGIASGSTVSWTDVNGHVTSIAASLVQSAQVAATIPANLLTTIGTAEVAISDPSGVLSNQLPFTISPFAISSVTPSSAAVGTDSTAVAIAGQNITAGSNVFWTTPDGRTITISPSLLQAAQVRATIPSTLLTTAGTAQVAVANANGFPSNGLPFTIIPFTLTGVTPSTAPVGSGNTQITISGPGFSSSAQALFTPPGGPQTPISSLVQGAQIAATIPASMLTTAGTAQISVRNANGVVSTNLLPFTIVPAPLTIQTTAIPGGWVNSGYAPFTIQAIGGTGALTWSATGLPAGFTLNPTTGALGGSAGASAGIYSVTVHVTDSGTPTPQTTSKTFSLQISQQFVISTIAGGVPPATPVPATSVSIGSPVALARDTASNLYFVSLGSLFKVDASGTLTRIAGTGKPGYSGDGGPAVNAQINPTGIVVDGNGNIYLADNGRIRKITGDGAIHTFAGIGPAGYSGDGGLAISAGMDPEKLALDSHGNLFFSDPAAVRVRKITAATGIVSTVAGTGVAGYSGDGGPGTSAQLNFPAGVAVDSVGNVYVADSGNLRVRRISPAGTISTFAGNGVYGESGAGGPAVNAEIGYPIGLATDSEGAVYIQGIEVFWKVATDGTIGTYVTDNAFGDIAVDNSGDVFVSPPISLAEFSPVGAETVLAGNGALPYSGDGGPATAAQFSYLGGVVTDTAGNVYIADSYNYRIRKISAAGVISTYAGTGSYGYSGDGGAANAAQIGTVVALTIDAAGSLYLAEIDHGIVRKVTSAGIISTVAGSGTPGFSGDGGQATAAQLDPTGLAVDQSGNLYISDGTNIRVRKVTPAGIITTVAGTGVQGNSGDGGPATSATLSYPMGLAVDPAGSLYIADEFNSSIRKVTPNGLITTLTQGLTQPVALAIDRYNNLIEGGVLGSVTQVSSNGTQTALAGAGGNTGQYSGDGGPSVNARLQGVQGVAVDTAGNIYVADSANASNYDYTSAIRILQPSTAAPLTVSANLATPYAVQATGGTGSYTYSALASALPPGLTLNSSTGVFSGTATTPGTYDFTVTVTDSGTAAQTGTPAQVASQNFRITIAQPAPTLSSITPAGGVVGTAVNVTLNGANFDYASTVLFTPPNAAQVSITPSMIQSAQLAATIPAALLTTAGTAQVAVTNSSGTTSNALTFNIAGLLIIATPPLHTVVAGQSYSRLIAIGGTPPYTCSITAGSLPTGISLNSATCVLSGTTTAIGTYNFTLGLSDSGSPPQTASRSYTLTVAPPLVLTGSPLSPAVSGRAYSVTLASGGITPYNCSLQSGGLPTGLTLTSTTCTISGTPMASGMFSFTVNANDSGNPAQTGSMGYSLTVHSPVAITSSSLPGGQVGVFYPGSLSVAGGIAPYSSWMLTSGALPPGLSLNPNNGAITGTPSSAIGSPFVFYVTVQDSLGDVSSPARVSLAIAPLTPTALTLSTSVNPVVFGQPLTITATVTPSNAAGQVLFFDGVRPLEIRTVASGKATLTTSLLASGSRPLTAYFTGPGFAGSTAPLQTETVKVRQTNGFQAVQSTAAGSGPVAAATGDFNGDGVSDLVIANSNDGTVSVLLGKGDGTFAAAVAYPAGMGPSSVLAGDVNGDGIDDIIVTDAASGVIGGLQGNGDGTFQAFATIATVPGAIALADGDFNHDGSPDGAIVSKSGNTVTVALSQGDGGMAYPVGTAPVAIVTGDFNGDGNADIAVANSGSNNVSVLLGNPDGTFQEAVNYAAGTGPSALTAGDFNGDGKLDLGIANSGGSNVSVLLGNGDGTFQTAVSYAAGNGPSSVVTGDFNGDGKPDLAVGNSVGSNVSVLLGNGDGTFQAPANYATPSPAALVVADFNGDGRSDLAVPAGLTGSTVGVLLGAVPQPLVISTTTLPGAVAGVAYSSTLAASGGIPPYSQWTVASGTLPPGLTLNSSLGVIAGTPSMVSLTPASFSLTVTDSLGNVSSAQTLSVSVSSLLTTTAPALPNGVLGTTYSAALAQGGTAPYMCSIGSGALPAGVTLNAASCAVGGTPTTAGSATFTLNASDSGSPAQTASQSYTVQVEGTLSITTVSLPPATTGQPYTTSLTAMGGAPPVAWFLSSGTLPSPLSLDPMAGTITGTPSAHGTFPVTVQAKDTVQAAQKQLTLNIYDPVAITTSALPGGTAGQSYTFTLTGSGGSGTYLWSATGLPSGLTLSSAGQIGGSLASGGTYPNVVVTLTDNTAAQSVSKTFSMMIGFAPLQITTSAALGGIGLGSAVSKTFSATGGKPPYSWSATGLPTGLGIDPVGGSITGTATQPGVFPFTVTVTDAEPISISVSGSLSVLGLSTTSLPAASTTAAYSQTLMAVGGTPPYTFIGSGVPAGMTLSGGGVLSGTSKFAGSYSIGVQVTDSAGVSISGTLALTVTAPAGLTVSAISLSNGTVGSPYSDVLAANGGKPPYTWSAIAGTVPPGLSVASSGTVSGMPATAGNFNFTASAVDSAGASASAPVSIAISPKALTFTTGALPNGIVGSQYPAQTFTASGGTAPYTFAITSGSLPAQLSFANGQVTGTPTAQGTASFTVTVTDAASQTASGSFQIAIAAAHADLILSSGSLSFALTSGAAALPVPYSVPVQSSVVQQLLNYTVAVPPAATWLTLTGGNTTPGTIGIALNSQALTLAASPTPYQTTIAVTCVAPSPCAGNTQNIAVSLTVAAPPPQLSVSTVLLSFSISTGSPAAATQSFGIQNTGGGSIGIQSVSAADPWLSVSGVPGSVAAGVSVPLTVTADPSSLSSGYYRSTIDIKSSAGSASVPVALLFAQSQTMSLSPAGLQFTQQAGGAAGNPNGSFLVGSAAGSINWTASVLPGANWLILGTASGTSTASNPAPVNFSIDPVAAAALGPQTYYGSIRVSSGDAVNSPQDFEVVLNVTAAAAPAKPDPEPAGLVFISGSTALPPQSVDVYASSQSAISYQASAATMDGANWLAVSPSTGTTSSASPGASSVSVSSAGLAAGVYRGTVSYSFSAAAVRSVNVTLIVPAQAAAPFQSDAVSAHAATCSPTQLVPTQTGLVSNFAQPAAWPTPLAIGLYDNCGSSVPGGQVVATFSNGDPPVILLPTDSASGVYSGTWTPRAASSQVTISARATAGNFPAATAQITGQVTPNNAPLLTPHGTLNVFSPLVGGSLGPGNIVQIYGNYLSSQTLSATSIPLPSALNGTSVIVGGIQVPLYFVSPGQINAQVPFELAAGNQYQVVVSANGALTTPDSIQLTQASPGIAALAAGQLIAQHSDGSLVTASSPAVPGEYVVFYMSGLGVTTTPVASGTASPSSPLAVPLTDPVLTLNGADVPILFAGLTPGLVGLYQVNFQVPANAPTGDLQLVVSQQGAVSNVTILPVKN